jgi:hypothetical protein
MWSALSVSSWGCLASVLAQHWLGSDGWEWMVFLVHVSVDFELMLIYCVSDVSFLGLSRECPRTALIGKLMVGHGKVIV